MRNKTYLNRRVRSLKISICSAVTTIFRLTLDANQKQTTPHFLQIRIRNEGGMPQNLSVSAVFRCVSAVSRCLSAVSRLGSVSAMSLADARSLLRPRQYMTSPRQAPRADWLADGE